MAASSRRHGAVCADGTSVLADGARSPRSSGARGSRRRAAARRRGRAFTLVELLVAGVIITLVLGAVGLSLSQVGRARSTSRVRLEAYMRADAALDAMRRDLQSAIRSDDLFLCRVLLFDDAVSSPLGVFDRDEVLVYNNRLQPVRPTDYNGEGNEFETQYRVQEDELGAALWQRRDPQPDRYELGGGVATPCADGVLGLRIEAYDGESQNWYDEWDSDEMGLPWALRIAVTVTGAPNGEDPYDPRWPLVTLRTVVPIDRVPPPYTPPTEEELAAEAAAEGEGAKGATDAAAEGAGGGGGGRGGGGAAGGGGGSGRGGGGGGGGRGSGGGGGRGSAPLSPGGR